MGKLQLFFSRWNFYLWNLTCTLFFSYFNFLIFHDFTTLGSWMETRLHTAECNIRISDLESSAAQKTRLLSTWIGNGMKMKKKSHEALNDGKKTKSTQCNAEEVSSPSREPQLLSVHEKMKRRKKICSGTATTSSSQSDLCTPLSATTLARRRGEESGGWRGLSLDAPRGRWRRLSTLKAIWGDAETERSPPSSSHTVENSRESRACLRSSVKPPTRSLYVVCDMLSEERIETSVEWMKVNGRHWVSLTNIVAAAVQPLQLSTRCYSLLIHFIRLLR